MQSIPKTLLFCCRASLFLTMYMGKPVVNFVVKKVDLGQPSANAGANFKFVGANLVLKEICIYDGYGAEQDNIGRGKREQTSKLLRIISLSSAPCFL